MRLAGQLPSLQGSATCRVADQVGLALLRPVRRRQRRLRRLPLVRDSARRRAILERGAELLRYLTSFEAQLGEARRGAIPCRSRALARVREEAAGNPVDAARWQLLAETEATMIVPPRFAAYPRCEDAIWHAVQQAMIGASSPEEAVAHAADEVHASIVEEVESMTTRDVRQPHRARDRRGQGNRPRNGRTVPRTPARAWRSSIATARRWTAPAASTATLAECWRSWPTSPRLTTSVAAVESCVATSEGSISSSTTPRCILPSRRRVHARRDRPPAWREPQGGALRHSRLAAGFTQSERCDCVGVVDDRTGRAGARRGLRCDQGRA